MKKTLPVIAAACIIPAVLEAQPSALIADVTLANYPPDAVRQKTQGDADVRVDLADDGIIDRCEVVHSSGYAILDAASCPLLLHSRIGLAKLPRARFDIMLSWRLPLKFGPAQELLPSTGASQKAIPINQDFWIKGADLDAIISNRGGFRTKGHVKLGFTVDAFGRAVACHVEQPSGISDLDRAACALVVKRAIFITAHDASGNPVSSAGEKDIEWRG